MSYRRYLCRVVEGSRIELEKLPRYCDAASPGRGYRIVRDAFNAMYSAVTGFVKSFESRVSRSLFGFRIRIDSPPPRIVGDRLLTGFWTGVFEYGAEDGFVRIAVVPRLRNYGKMVRAVDEFLASISWHFYLVSRISVAASATASLHPIFQRLLLELNRLLLYEPRRICRYVEGVGGPRILLSGFGTGGEPLYTVLRHVCNPNKALLTALVLAARGLARALQTVERVAMEIVQDVRGLGGDDRVWQLQTLVESYVSGLRRALGAILGDEVMQQALSVVDVDLEGVDRYPTVFAAIKRLERGAVYTQPVAGGEEARFLLFPSTKLYELYVYANILRALTSRGGYTYVEPLAVDIDVDGRKVKAYFNYVEPPMSRFIRPLIRALPTPDIVLSSNSKAVVVDAKYRRISGRDAKGVRLTLGDAERLAAYIFDIARDAKLLAAVVALEKPREEVVNNVKRAIKPIDTKEIGVEFLELNPDSEEDPEKQLKPLIDYLTGS